MAMPSSLFGNWGLTVAAFTILFFPECGEFGSTFRRHEKLFSKSVLKILFPGRMKGVCSRSNFGMSHDIDRLNVD